MANDHPVLKEALLERIKESGICWFLPEEILLFHSDGFGRKILTILDSELLSYASTFFEVRDTTEEICRVQWSYQQNNNEIISSFYIETNSHYQKQGIGSGLLNFFIHFVKAKCILEIYGKAAPKGSILQEELISWYQKYGFEVRNTNTLYMKFGEE